METLLIETLLKSLSYIKKAHHKMPEVFCFALFCFLLWLCYNIANFSNAIQYDLHLEILLRYSFPLMYSGGQNGHLF